MQSRTLEILEAAGADSKLARAIAQAIDVEVDARRDLLATKSDVGGSRREIAEAKWDIIKTAIGLLVIGLTCVFFMVQNLK
jgi:hypothetical protein